MSKADRYNFCNKCDENERDEYGDRCMACVPMLELCQALKLQELVKKRIPEIKRKLEYLKYEGNMANDEDITNSEKVLELTRLVEQSQTTLKELGEVDD